MLVSSKVTVRSAAIALAVSAISSASPASADTYKYDALGRLRCVTYENGMVAIYTYDDAGNRTNVQIGSGLTCPI